MERISVFLVDGHIIFRQGLRAALSRERDMEVVWEGDDGEEALTQLERLAPDVVLVDSKLAAMSGLELARRVRLHAPKVCVVVLSAYEEEEQLFLAIKAGAAAYFTKDAPPEVLVEGIRRAARGEYLINESVLTRASVASRVLKQFQEMSLTEKRKPGNALGPLSSRQVEILDFMSHGKSNKEIGRELFISDQTVKNHITAMLRKLAVRDRTQAVVLALREGWIASA
jgi:DNA-binding NarL/FixJ family response regulator